MLLGRDARVASRLNLELSRDTKSLLLSLVAENGRCNSVGRWLDYVLPDAAACILPMTKASTSMQKLGIYRHLASMPCRPGSLVEFKSWVSASLPWGLNTTSGSSNVGQ